MMNALARPDEPIRNEARSPGLVKAARAGKSPGGVTIHSKSLLGCPPRLEPERRGALTSVDALGVIRQACARVASRAAAKGIDMVIYCTCGRVTVEPRALEEALGELLDNAIQASRPGRPVIVDVRETSEGDILWEVRDTGAGMTPSTLRRIGASNGAGSGLALAWSIVDRHQGLLHFESAEGAGTVASIWLPALPARVGASRAPDRRVSDLLPA